ncbi:penicillin-binding protein [Novosphingobium marinum]|uniref:Penicillin-binding protein 1A n=1 Tax=Novosphingobium marinum TaxID=1514948 RepID=A0A7Y9XVZ7_9SPHN|nr:transglycosylase domain-containing protein [Novosphingobium marinum]NYH94093.1 penicillin-binding protein 1A [Novosphingobium marinum]GGC19540.1 penicillin-binding protein [Novosphingobium marinum]
MSEPSEAEENLSYKVRREASGLASRLARMWRERKWLRRLLIAAAILVVVFLIAWTIIVRSLPSADKLLDYQPPLPTMVRGIDGEIVYSYARERRVQLRFVDFPEPLTNAFLSAEDKTFWSHGGVDLTGLAGAVVDYVSKLGSGQRAKGGSTITQQVAKNILIGDEYSVTRKLKEMVLARRIESVLTKEQILELYLNEIPLGRQSFGVQAASRAYFGKDVGELELHEAAFLAILPKAPERYSRAKHADLAIARRNYVLEQMVENGWATRAEADAAKAQPLGLIRRQSESYDSAGGYFVEEVRRRLIERYGETAEDGDNSVYAGGLWVRTSLDTEMQRAARNALRAGLLRYHAGKGWRGPIDRITDLDPDRWQSQVILANKSVDYEDWRVGVVLSLDGNRGRIGFADGESYDLTNIPDRLRTGDLIAAAPAGSGSYAVRTIPEVAGGMVVEEVDTGRVVAVQGGFDSGLGSFNRATQAMRQPGSTIKPFVYATGLEAGMTPASMVLDGQFCVYQGAALGQKCFRNFGGGGGGTHTMRWGLEQSRNLMTVRIANDSGMDRVTKTFSNVGIGDYKPYLSFALGAGETTVLRMVNAYAALANQGVQYDATLIDYVQDRNGKVIWRADSRRCVGCDMDEWDGKPMPRLEPRGKQVMDPRTAFQTVHMLTGVVTRGTAVVLRDLGLPLFGKTGTTTGPTNVWFVGGSQKYVSGVYLGFDQPRSMGGYAQGGRLAAPVFKQLVQETKDRWRTQPFIAPEGVRMVKIDRRTGKRVFGAEPGSDPKASVIWEAFQPDTEPKRSTADEFAQQRDALIAAIRRGRQAQQSATRSNASASEEPKNFAEEQGGVY